MPSDPVDAFRRLVELTERLRSPEGCAWDRAQTTETIRPHLVEEFHEVLEAMDVRDSEKLRDELGDLLFLVVFMARVSEESGDFDLAAVLAGIDTKLRRRHPHVFGDKRADTPDDVRTHWETTKLTEETHSGRRSILDGLPRELPALLAARRLQEKAAAVGFDWKKMEDVLLKIDEELAELRNELSGRERCEEARDGADSTLVEEELGDLLFAVVNAARFLNVDPEAALRRTNLKFRRRFAAIENRFRGRDLTEVGLEAMDGVWEDAKDEERR
jgi:MazG family protein